MDVLKLLGAVLVLIGGSSMGLCAARELRQRSRTLEQFLAALDQIQAELSFRLTPMPELLQQLGQASEEPLKTFFQTCEGGLSALGEVSFSVVWNRALREEALALLPEDRLSLEQLGAVLGRYDAEGQRTTLESVRVRLSQCLEDARGKQKKMGRVYRTLGVSAGVLCVLLLI